MKNRYIIMGLIVIQIGLSAGLSRSASLRPAFSDSKQSAIQEIQWGGYLRVLGSVAWPTRQGQTLWGNDPNLTDGYGQFRLNNDLFFNSGWRFQTHYESLAAVGDTVEATDRLQEQFPEISAAAGSTVVIDDDRRLMDLTRTIENDRRHLIYHRLDRLNLTLTRPWGMVRLGRQALTWGNGLVFHPMDLFNPFSPTAITKDYKTGDDMAMAQIPAGSTGDLQILYVPRRDPITRDPGWDQSSLAGKYHLSTQRLEMDVMAAYHFGDAVMGIGTTGTVRDAAWRFDATWTFPDDENSNAGDYLSAVANIDYAWTWWEKNFYGLVEFYFNGLGENNHPAAARNTSLLNRLQRGDLFVTGRSYLAGEIQIEAHPLVRINLGAIYNLGDRSGLLQPRIVWDLATNWQLITGIRWYTGGRNTEFGGNDDQIASQTVSFSPLNTAFLQVTRFF